MFEDAGRFVRPTWLCALPDAPRMLFRGCSEGRLHRLSWTADRNLARQFAARQRHAADATAVYQIVAPAAAVLAIMRRGDTEHATWIVDPRLVAPQPCELGTASPRS